MHEEQQRTDLAVTDDLVMGLVERALAQPAEDRESYLRNACASQPELFTVVWNYVEWEQRMNGFLLDPLHRAFSEAPQLFESGQILLDRFRIVREVAQGGMGIVYEAIDQRLNRRIAIKCAKTGFRKRLPPEVRNASEISHGNVCKTFDIYTAPTSQGDVDFLTMEFLDGQTLAERLRSGAIPKKVAREIALQLCAGLAEAHRIGVIHGDLKSNNVFLTTSSDGRMRAVITDFGLAQRSDGLKRTFSSEQAAGTPDYMAPELWKGGKASVASDIYALGVILYEMASGHMPFPSEAPWTERLNQPPPPLHSKWDPILMRCLDPDPARRFANAREVSSAIAPSGKRVWFALAAAAVVVVAIVTGLVTEREATTPRESVSLTISPLAAPPDLALLAGKLTQDTANHLEHLKGSADTGYKFIRLRQTPRGPVDAVETAIAKLRATHLLRGTIQKENGGILLHAYLVDARTHAIRWDWNATYAPGQERYIPVAMAGFVTESLHLPPLAVTTMANAARGDYEAGLKYLRRDSTIDAALESFRQAVATDSDSPLTYAGLAEAQWFRCYPTKDPQWLKRATESSRQAELRNPDLAPVHTIVGAILANSGLYELAEAEFRRAIELDPNNADALRRLGLAYQSNNQLNEALDYFQRAVQVDPQYYRSYQTLGTFYVRRGDYGEAVKVYQKMVEVAPDEAVAHFALGAAYLDMGSFPDAEKELLASRALSETSATLNSLGVSLMYQEKYQEAIPIFTSALQLSPNDAVLYMNRGIAYSRQKSNAAAERDNLQGLSVASNDSIRNGRNGTAHSFMAYFYAVLGHPREAEVNIAEALSLMPKDEDVKFRAVLTYVALHELKEAVDTLSDAPDGVVADVSRWPDLAELHQDSRFVQLLASKNIK
jgi:serine/threonine-protein kinase